MECNKEEAVRAKEISEKKLLERDITGAQKFALKAHSLFPNLDGLSQFLEIMDFYITHEKKIYGEPDYYGIFRVSPLADDETLKKQYKEMALSLHPDKNKSVGADGALKILSQAWSVLSNKDTRNAYNLRMNRRSSYQMDTLSSSNSHIGPTRPRTPVTMSGRRFQNIRVSQQAPTAATAFGAQFNPSQRPPFPRPSRNQANFSLHASKPETFWRSCNRCKMYYEYQKIYLNQNLLCPRCHQPVLTIEIPAPSLNSFSSSPWFFPNLQHADVPASATKTTPAASCQKSGKCMKRKHEILKNNSSTVSEKVEEVLASNVASSGREKPRRRRRDDHRSANVKELSQIEIRDMLIRKAKIEVTGLLNQLKTENSESFVRKREETKDSVSSPLENDTVSSIREEQRSSEYFSDSKNTSQPLNFFTLEEKDEPDVNPDETVSMVVPDANFHNFDDDRIEKSFAENQIWAAYDDDDGMPRYYAMVHHVISRNPFKMQISWLNSKSSSEFGSLDWIGCGFTKTTGNFRVGKSVVSNRLNSFSHAVKWRKGARGVIHIFPRKGEVWALYRNWSPEWDEITEDEKIHQYDLVVILQGYNEDRGVLVAPLVKVAGFTSVFNLLLDQKNNWSIQREEMFRFSHQVPFYILNGLESENALKGLYELDPAALPLELLNVITDAEAAMQRVPEKPGQRLDVKTEAMEESIKKTSATGERGVAEDGKRFLTYSRKRKGKKTDGDVEQSQRPTSLHTF